MCPSGAARGVFAVSHRRPAVSPSFARFRFPPEVILFAVRWYLRCACRSAMLRNSSPSVAREVDHVAVHRRVQRFTSLGIEAARPWRHSVAI